ncbi:conserved oligomeric golgi complex component 5 [Anaeramoeba flamelloides]|uniref:Conserved oligomeric golgi complex component 5 n=1 Tax=Anaeramoeba flamelloides TaxID=1746091 RepID=A0ABQ8XY28_9EUKA|nr:conserved oligomeric golgi complex component 5 [Anaeramoeba flamelloides]
MDQDLINQFSTNKTLKPLLSTNYSSTDFIKQTLQTNSVFPTLGELSKGKEIVEECLEQVISKEYIDLFKRLLSIQNLENTNSEVQKGVNLLNQGMTDISKLLNTEHSELTNSIEKSKRLIMVIEILEILQNFVEQIRKLSKQMGKGTRELVLASITLKQIERSFFPKKQKEEKEKAEIDLNSVQYYEQSVLPDLSSLSIMKNGKQWITKLRLNILKQADILVRESLEENEESKLETAFTIYNNLGVLQERVKKQIAARSVYSSEKIETTLNMSNVSQIINTQGERELTKFLWGRIVLLMEIIYAQFSQIWLINHILSTTHETNGNQRSLLEIYLSNNSSYSSFSNQNNTDKNVNQILHVFWKSLVNKVKDRLTRASNQAPQLQLVIIQNYPKLITLVHDTLEKINGLAEIQGSSSKEKKEPLVDSKLLLLCFSSFENLYLSQQN